MEQRYLPNDPDTWRILEELRWMLLPWSSDQSDSLHETRVVFRLGDAYYSLPTLCIRAIQPLGQYTPLPLTHAGIVGIVPTQGRLLVVVDIRPLLALPWVMPHPRAMLLQVTLNEMDVGLLVDSIVVAPRHCQIATAAQA